MEPVRLGIVGCGVIGRNHLQNARQSPLVNVLAVADMREAAAREAAEKFSVPTVYTSADDLFADARIEAMVLALPTQNRTALALKALASGKHVLIEKPVAMNADEVHRMIAARGDRVAACCSSRFRFLESARVVTDFLAAGTLGELRVVRCRAIVAAGEPPKTAPPAWRLSKSLNGGGILVNWGCYDLDFLLGVTGWSLKPQLVLAQTWPVPPQVAPRVAAGSDAETHYAALIRCQGGVTLTMERGEYMAAASEESWQIIGARGSLRSQMTPAPDKKVWHDESHADRAVASKVIWQGNESYATGNAGVLQDFAGAIREGRPPKTSLEQSLVIQQITDAIYSSVATGRAVAID